MPLREETKAKDSEAGVKDRFLDWWNGVEDAPRGTVAGSDAEARSDVVSPESPRTIAEPDGYVPLKQRLMAWWTGLDTGNPLGQTDPSLRITTSGSNGPDSARWTPEWVRVSQSLWGPGCTLPSSEAFTTRVMAGLKLDRKNTILNLAPGLCGTALQLVEKKKIWIEAVEPDPVLHEHAVRTLHTSKFGNHIDLREEDFASLTLPPLRYHTIFARERLFSSFHKQRVIDQVCRALRSEGQLMLIDYMVKEEGSQDEAIKDWYELERHGIDPWSVRTYRQALSQAGVSVKTCDDFSEFLIREIKDAWLRMLDNIKTGEFKPTDVDALLYGGNLWHARLRALQSGELRLVRIFARKNV